MFLTASVRSFRQVPSRFHWFATSKMIGVTMKRASSSSSHHHCSCVGDGTLEKTSNPATYVQDAPRLGNQFVEDAFLQECLARIVPSEVLGSWTESLNQIGSDAPTKILDWGRDSERNPPTLERIDAWGKRRDTIRVASGWTDMQRYSSKHGLVALGYERASKEWSRMHQFIGVYLFSSSACVFDCPLAMTDGVASVIEKHPQFQTSEELGSVYEHLTTRDPDRFWTSGQWMTERTGGSDVNRLETVARKCPDADEPAFHLHGYKFFTSAITSEIAVTLARIEGQDRLSLFLLNTHLPDGDLNHLTVEKLKEKLGTRAVPTAELSLHGTVASLISEEGGGVRSIAPVLNITRLHNAANSVACMRRCVALCRDYATRRVVFGKRLDEQPLHLATLADMDLEYRAAMLLFLRVTHLLGRSECLGKERGNKQHEHEQNLLRFLTPLLKMYTAKQSNSVASECIEAIGGMAYCEDSDIPRLLRDSQVGSVWEGTTNIQALDIWRVIAKSKGSALDSFFSDVERMLPQKSDIPPSLPNAVHACRDACDTLRASIPSLMRDLNLREASAREFSYCLARTYMGASLIEHAIHTGSDTDAYVAEKWCTTRGLWFSYAWDKDTMDRLVGLGTFTESKLRARY
eukprot:TRINITY_DN1708_c0_g1_i2.p1 TRINITY_DN1708_c0_g1~~TRINITY_DN1708_c0_g1_i2.p1  ORF type:complete len:633 (-),score=101.40 TRINITY_DN1708_c0_g1_i2:2290-4188(-)